MNPVERFLELTEDWRFYIRRDGLFAALPVVAAEAAAVPFRRLSYVLFVRELGEPLPAVEAKIPLEIRPFRREDLEAARTMDRPSEGRLCAKRLAMGHRGLVALHEREPVGYAWGCAEINSEVERVHLRLEQGDVLCTDVFTVPAWRNNGVQTALALARFKLFRDLGYRRAICYIEARNTPSLAVWQRKLGCTTAGRIDFFRIGPWYRVRLQDAAGFHLEE
jgi:GNAT superfamily N-acetyltransferase